MTYLENCGRWGPPSLNKGNRIGRPPGNDPVTPPKPQGMVAP